MKRYKRTKREIKRGKSQIYNKIMLQRGYKYIVRLTRTVELYLRGGTLSDYMRANKVREGSVEAKHAIKVARALGYNIRYKRGVYFDVDEEKMTYYKE